MYPSYEQVCEAVHAGRIRAVKASNLLLGDIVVDVAEDDPQNFEAHLIMSTRRHPNPQFADLVNLQTATWMRRGGRYVLDDHIITPSTHLITPLYSEQDVVYDFYCDIEWQLFMESFVSEMRKPARPWESDMTLGRITLPRHQICRCSRQGAVECPFTRQRAASLIYSHLQVKRLFKRIISSSNVLPPEILEQVLRHLWPVLCDAWSSVTFSNCT